MAYTPHTLVAFGGTLNEEAPNDEVWECTVRGMSLAGGTPSGSPLVESSLDTYLSEVYPKLATWHAATATRSPATLTWIKANNIGADGKYTSPSTHVHDYAPVVAGGSGGTAPSFLSVAYSWRTARTRPPGAFGRIYYPNYGIASLAGNTSAITAAAATEAVAQAQALLTLLANKSGSIWFSPSVVSAKNGAHEPITAAFVGNVWDVQRRRKNAVREVYSGGPWTP